MKKLSPGMKLLLFFMLLISMQIMGDFFYGAILAIFTSVDSNTDFTQPHMQLSRMFTASVFYYVMAFYLYLRLTKEKMKDLFYSDAIKVKFFIIGILVLGAGMFIMSLLQEFNAQLAEVLPDNALIEIQLKNDALLNDLFDHHNWGKLLASIVVFAVIPAIAEELIFRGLLIGKLIESTNNIHFSVIIGAIIFSAMHFQPLNFLPILFMGICFGYIYVYFRNIRYTIVLHFINNLIYILIPFFLEA